MIGYEFELLVREGEKPLSTATFEKFHRILAKRGWKPKHDAGTGRVVASSKKDFIVTSDDGVCVMEINAPPRDTVQECDEQMRNLLSELQELYQNLGCSITGIDTFAGFFDVANRGCKEFCINEHSCQKSYIKYFNAQRFPDGHHALYVFAANQVWLDLPKSDLWKQWQIFNMLSPLLVALFSNGPVFNNNRLNVLEGRDVLWDTMLSSSVVEDDTRFYGMPEKPFASLIEYFDHIFSMPFYFDLRDGKGYKLTDPKITYGEFFQKKEVEAQLFDGTTFTTQPQPSDFWGLQQRTFPHVRIKYTLKPKTTVSEIMEAYQKRDDAVLLDCFSQVNLECRAIGNQPQKDLSAGPALLIGLQKNIDIVEQFVEERPYEHWYSLYGAVQRDGLLTKHEGASVTDLLNVLIDFAERGLKQRDYGEERYLAPLRQRVQRRQNPAQELLEIWGEGGLPAVWKQRDYRLGKDTRAFGGAGVS